MNVGHKTIDESLKPTFENVTREFIVYSMHELLFNDEIPNIGFEFTENEAVEFIEKILNDFVKKNDCFYKESKKIIDNIKHKEYKGNIPVMIINNYKEFFNLLRQIYERDIELFLRRTDYSGFPVYEKDNLFKEIWLRMTPEDFNHPEYFLKKQALMIKDETFHKFDKETYLGKLSFLDNNIICTKNGIARTWDENFREFQFIIYDKEYYHNNELFNRPHYTLPVIRYGIYEKEGKKICSIGSIQNKNYEKDEEKGLKRRINREKYKINKEINDSEVLTVEPNSILTLSLFINLLHQEGITDIEIPGMYVLDYEYHEKRNKVILKEFKKEWEDEKRREKFSKWYQQNLIYMDKNYEKQDLISEIKTERFIRIFQRILYHFPKGKINSYPGEADNLLHINIPIIKNKNDINGDILKEFYELVDRKYNENER